MGQTEEPVTILNINKGAAVELFDRAFEQIKENLADPSTAAEESRTITLTFTFKQNEKRRMAAVNIGVKTKLAVVAPAGGIIYLGKRKGELLAVISDPDQMDIFKEEPPAKFPVVADTRPPSQE